MPNCKTIFLSILISKKNSWSSTDGCSLWSIAFVNLQLCKLKMFSQTFYIKGHSKQHQDVNLSLENASRENLSSLFFWLCCVYVWVQTTPNAHCAEMVSLFAVDVQTGYCSFYRACLLLDVEKSKYGNKLINSPSFFSECTASFWKIWLQMIATTMRFNSPGQTSIKNLSRTVPAISFGSHFVSTLCRIMTYLIWCTILRSSFVLR